MSTKVIYGGKNYTHWQTIFTGFKQMAEDREQIEVCFLHGQIAFHCVRFWELKHIECIFFWKIIYWLKRYICIFKAWNQNTHFKMLGFVKTYLVVFYMNFSLKTIANNNNKNNINRLL